jgi:cytochrome c biogenesis factor
VHAGTAFAWAGATLLVAATHWRWRASATVASGFAAFALGLGGLTLRRAGGWDGVHAFALTTPGRVTAWALLIAVMLAVVAMLRRAGMRAAQGVTARLTSAAQVAVLLVGVALAVAGFPRATEVALGEGARTTVTDRFGTPWVISLEGVSAVGRGDVVSGLVALRASVNGRARAFVLAELRDSYTGGSGRPVEELGVAGIAPGLSQDLRIDVHEANTADALATVRFIPAASWVWIAGTCAVLAALLLAFIGVPAEPGRGAGLEEPADETEGQPSAAAGQVEGAG